MLFYGVNVDETIHEKQGLKPLVGNKSLIFSKLYYKLFWFLKSVMLNRSV